MFVRNIILFILSASCLSFAMESTTLKITDDIDATQIVEIRRTAEDTGIEFYQAILANGSWINACHFHGGISKLTSCDHHYKNSKKALVTRSIDPKCFDTIKKLYFDKNKKS